MRIDVLNLVDNQDGSATMTVDIDEEAVTMLVEKGLMALLRDSVVEPVETLDENSV